MKTKEEIIKHLHDVGYTEHATSKIMGFLIGSGLKDKDELIKAKKGLNDFEHFWKWVKCENNDENIDENVKMLLSIITDVLTIGAIRFHKMSDLECEMLERKLEFLRDTMIEYSGGDDEE